MRALLLLVVATCTPAPSPPVQDAAPPPPPAPTVVVGPVDQHIYDQLVEAGCMASSLSGVSAVAAERQQYGDLGLACMADGGSVKSCNVPCNPMGLKLR